MCSTRPRVWQAHAGRKSGWRPAQDASGRRARSGQRSGSGVQRGEQPELPAASHAPVSFMDASCALPLFLRKGTGRGVRPAQCSEKLSVISSATIGAASARGHLRHATCDLLRRTPDLSAVRVWRGQRTRWDADLCRAHAPPVAVGTRARSAALPGFQLLMAGTMVSALVHPWFYVLMGFELWRGPLIDTHAVPTAEVLRWMSYVILLAGYALGIGLGAVAVLVGRRERALLLHAVLTPVYWLLVSLAA
jgi:hypothetical protein